MTFPVYDDIWDADTTVNSVQDGNWNDASTWDAGVPDGTRDVIIHHRVVLGKDGSNIVSWKAKNLLIEDGPTVGLTFNAGRVGGYANEGQPTLTVDGGIYMLTRHRTSGAVVRLDGVKLVLKYPGFSGNPYCTAVGLENPDFINDVFQDDNRDVIIEDPGQVLTGYRLQDITPEGNARAYARKIGNGVRSMTVGVRVRASKPVTIAYLQRMAEMGYEVIASTDSAVLKGYIETIAPDASSVGKEYISVKVTIVEGQ